MICQFAPWLGPSPLLSRDILNMLETAVSAGLTSVIIKKALDSTAYTTLVSSNQLEKTEATFLMETGLSAQSNQF